MNDSPQTAPSSRCYFVDEAGDGNLFDRKGKVIIGEEGCSRFFILGLLDVSDTVALDKAMRETRKKLLADPYFRNVPSMQPSAKKTAMAFHAKDDLPEVRREVFALLLRHELRFFAVVRDKAKVLDYVRQRNQVAPEYRYHPNDLYDFLVRSLFRDRLHKEAKYMIHFAKRGKSDRTDALSFALESARRRFSERWGIVSNADIEVIPSVPANAPGLQATDYFLWALQRFYERREERFLRLVWPLCRLVRDLDDVRHNRYGEYYTRKKPLTLTAVTS